MAHKPSEQQEAVFNFIGSGSGSLKLKARAGCGKTSTILMSLPYSTKAGKTNFVGAYNKAIAEEIKAKVETAGYRFPQVVVATMHSAGFVVWRKAHKDVKVDSNKIAKLLDEADKLVEEELANVAYRDHRTIIHKLVSLAKQRAFGFLYHVADTKNWFDIIEHFGLDEDVEGEPKWDDIIECAKRIYQKSAHLCKSVVDFDDMILAPLVYGGRFFQYDFVWIDEAQDTNPARRALAIKMLKPGTGRLIAVGDPAQAIYGFTGADSDSMDILQRQTRAVELPLTRTYRCGKKIVEMARQWVPDYEAAEGNADGVVRSVYLSNNGTDRGPLFDAESLTNADVILCRNTKPVVEMAYALIRKGTACYVEGRDIGQGLIKLIRKWDSKKTVTLLKSVAEYRDTEVAKWMAKGREGKAEAVADTCDTVTMLGEKLIEEGKAAVSELIDFINRLFGDTPDGEKPKLLTLCTIHRSKGREWRRVYLLGRNRYQPSKYARKEWQMEQENNLMYVAVTRAIEELVEIWVDAEPRR